MRLLKLFALLATLTATAAVVAQADTGPPWGPETPNFNLEAVLRPTEIGPEKGFGLVKFRQPNDGETRIYLDVWVRDLAPGQTYYVQRAADPADGVCTSQAWLTLGTISTDDSGTGRAVLSRLLPATLIGTEFDIRFRVAETQTATAGVLESGCYQYTVSL
jgi:hypothetical protein